MVAPRTRFRNRRGHIDLTVVLGFLALFVSVEQLRLTKRADRRTDEARTVITETEPQEQRRAA